MNIIKKVVIKQIVTEKSKEKIYRNFHDHKLRLEQECQQLLFEKRKLQNKAGSSKQEIEQRFQQEINNRKEKIKLLDFKISQLETLELGSEIIEKEVEALVEVKVGSNWNEIMEEQVIVIKDDVVVRIDE
ncbi:YlqD family protein [Oceanobacillus polygoni]|uniref:IS30 family transposase n=1 Tax=Oceanobacillus polygoni TaxID=1235259 RepID=A0A9X0YT20_9BACI|nr:YlqD family protein [Oceanobacillus polygoni]MBP2077632.1 IS30 family transposase [Oceanobacillus polygoni]